VIPAHQLRLALDQNFPTPLLAAIHDYLPQEISLTHLTMIDDRMPDLDDRPLIIALHQMGWDGLVTNNYRMLNVPEEIAAIVQTKTIIVAVERLGHDPIRAVGALLLELPTLPQRVQPKVSNVFDLNYQPSPPKDAWDYLKRAAGRRHQEVSTLWSSVRLSPDELARPVLD
jgi:hypothetical protein